MTNQTDTRTRLAALETATWWLTVAIVLIAASVAAVCVYLAAPVYPLP